MLRLATWPPEADAAVYVDMAANLRQFTTPPLGFRLMAPWLVHLLGWAPLAGFALVNTVALLLTAVLVARSVTRLGAPPGAAWMAGALFLVSPATGMALTNPCLVDPLAHAFTAAGLLAIVEGRRVVTALVIAVGVFARESVLFLILPAVASAWVTRPDTRTFARGLPWLGLPLASFALLHTPGVFFDNEASYVRHFTREKIRIVLAHKSATGGIPRNVVFTWVATVGPVIVPLVRGFRAADARTRALGWLVLPVLALVPFIKDTHRVVLLAAPLGCLFAVLGMRSRREGWVHLALTALTVAALFLLPSRGALKYAMTALGLLGSPAYALFEHWRLASRAQGR